MSREQPELNGTIFDDWMRTRRLLWRPSTYRSLQDTLICFAPLCKMPVAEIRKSTVEMWLAKLEVGPNTRRLYRGRLASVFNWAIDEGRVETNPVARVKVKAGDTDRRALSADEAAEWLRAARARSHHLETLGMFGLYSGLRVSNLLALDNSRIKRDRIVFPGEMMKAGRRFELPLHPVLQPLLNRLPIRLGQRRAQMLFKEVEPQIRPHDLRHTFGTWLASLAPWPVVAACLGHTRADNSPTAIYVHITFEQMREALLRLPRLV